MLGSMMSCLRRTGGRPGQGPRAATARLNPVEGAAFRVTYRTAYHALRSVGEAQEGDWVVVLGGAGGVGTAAIDVAKRLGCLVVAAAGGAEKVAVCRDRGADAVIDYTTETSRSRSRPTPAVEPMLSSIPSVGRPPRRRSARAGGERVLSASGSRPARFRAFRSTWCC